MNQDIIWLKDHKKPLKKNKNFNMFFLVIIIGTLIGLVLWHFFVNKVDALDVKIPESKNLTFNDKEPTALTISQIANELENADGKPILLYIYTTWCKICTNNFPEINELAREFQNTELKFLAIAIDRNLEAQHFQYYLNSFGNLYFEPKYLAFKDGFVEFLHKKHINYDNRIPFTVLISRQGDVIVKASGKRGKAALRKKIVKELYPSN